MIHTTFLLLGSNLGEREYVLEKAATTIETKIGKVKTYSSIYETMAWGNEDQPAFLNQVIVVETSLNPEDLLVQINSIEKDLGRVRHEKWGERLIDIDILYFDDVIIDTEKLTIPHPEIVNRKFTLIPLAEIAADFVHPLINKKQKELLQNCKDELEVKRKSF